MAVYISDPGFAQFRLRQRHQACAGVVEGKTRDNTLFTQLA
ncbi:hypothetical protein [Paraglaciecola sp. 25GB23A]